MTDERFDIVIIDDCEISSKVSAQKFRKYGLSVATTSDDPLKIDNLLNSRPKVVITDMMMPTMDGTDVAIRFSELKIFDTSFLYLYTSSAKELTKEKVFAFKSLGISGIFKKPFSLEVIEMIVNAHFSKSS